MENRYLNSLERCEILLSNNNENDCSARIRWRGQLYSGTAWCSSEDMEFFSEKVGYNIALMRAQLEALEDFLQFVKGRLATILGMENIALINIDDASENAIDFLDRQRHREELRLARVQYAIKSKKKELQEYLDSEKTFIEAVKKHRKNKEEK